VQGILCTHGHRRHIASALTLSDVIGADVHLHPDDYGLWHEVFPTRWPERVLLEGLTVDVGRTQLVGIHVPGHTDGGMCWHAAELGALFTGDSLGADGVGPASSSSDRARLLSAVRARLFTLPVATTLHPGHGPDVRLGTVRGDRSFWA
jgi:glyoxylase-like metal-dependent hydrolase (beta-lactamase superfamily II)